MKRRIKLSTLLKRTVIAIIAIVVVTVILVFAFDKYSPTDNTYTNKYDDAYWNQSILTDFEYSQDILKRADKYNLNNKAYVAPWTALGLEEKDVTLEQRVELGRYREEHNSICKIISTTFDEYKVEKRLFDSAKAWTEKTTENSVFDWILSRFEYSQEEVEEIFAITDPKHKNAATKELVDAYATAYEYILDCSFDGEYEEFVKILQSYSKGSDIENALKNKSNKSDFADMYDELALVCLISKDVQLYQDVCEFDYDAYNNFIQQYNYYEDLNNAVDERSSNLLQWKNYYQTTLLGFGGLATDYPEKPTLTMKCDDGSTLELWFNMYNTTFKLIKLDRNGDVVQTWESNPENDPTANYQVLQNQKAILNISYSVLKGQTDVYSSYEYSVSETNIYNDKLVPTYAVSVDPETNKLTVWYHLEKRGINYTNFPKYISKAKMDEYLARNKELAEAGEKTADGKPIIDITSDNSLYGDFCSQDSSFYRLVPVYNTINNKQVKNENNEFGYDYYELSFKHSSMTMIARDTLYKCLYEYSGYTEEDLASDNLEFSQEIITSNPSYEVAIEYTLTENGLDVCVPGNSIKEEEKYPLTYIDILPYFTATGSDVEGYTVIPDGSGAILNHTNGKTYPKYKKRVYTTDLTNTSYVNQGSNDDLMFPMYAVINTGNQSGMLTYATSNAAQLQLTADIAGRSTSEFGNFNVNYFTAYLRESKVITVGTHAYEKKQLTKWTANRVKDDISLTYHLLNEDQLSYSAAAKQYRDILIEMYGIDSVDSTKAPVLNMDVIGSYSYTENFIGIPYTAKGTLTTIDQLNEIINVFTDAGIDNINAFYLGWRKEGLKNTSFSKVKLANRLGSKAKFEQLFKEDTDNVNVYPYVSFGEINDFTESFGSTHYVTHAVDGDIVWKQPYDLNSNVFDKTKDKIYILSPRYYVSFANSLAKNYSNVTNGYGYLAIDKIGSELSGDYRKNVETFKVDAVRNQITSLEILSSSGINNMTLYKPYDYAFKYTDVAKNIPYQSTQYEILDYSVPFYQLVANGLFDYSGESFNANSEKGTMEHLMRMIETGSNMSFTLSGDSSEKLLPTEYNYYYYTLYTDWVDTIIEVYTKLNDLGIYDGELVEHECLGSNIYKVVYSTSNGDVTIYLNYTRNNYVAPDGTEVQSKDYAVVK